MNTMNPQRHRCWLPQVLFAITLATGGLPLLAQDDGGEAAETSAVNESSSETAAEPGTVIADSADDVARRLAAKAQYEFKYQLNADEQVFWKVEHVTTTKTQISGTTEEASARVETLSTWNVVDVNPSSGDMVFTNSIDAIKSWRRVGDEKPSLYDSRNAKTPPDEYADVAKTFGQPRSRITISPTGEVLDRQSDHMATDFSTGQITVPLPGKKVSPGYRWDEPLTFQSSNENGANVQLKARRLYEFLKVKNGKAYISYRTEVLTPIESSTVRSKILQKLINGFIVWDLKRGLPVQRTVLWDETVQGYDGADSFLKYVGRMTVNLIDRSEIEAVKREQTYTALEPIKVAPVKLRLINERPEMRR